MKKVVKDTIRALRALKDWRVWSNWRVIKRKYADTLSLRRSLCLRRYADTPIAVLTVRLRCTVANPKQPLPREP